MVVQNAEPGVEHQGDFGDDHVFEHGDVQARHHNIHDRYLTPASRVVFGHRLLEEALQGVGHFKFGQFGVFLDVLQQGAGRRFDEVG